MRGGDRKYESMDKRKGERKDIGNKKDEEGKD